MPIYVFNCKACGHKFEKRMGMDDPKPRKCPECGQVAVQQQITAGTLHMRYSPMHPRAMRGQRAAPKRKSKPS